MPSASSFPPFESFPADIQDAARRVLSLRGDPHAAETVPGFSRMKEGSEGSESSETSENSENSERSEFSEGSEFGERSTPASVGSPLTEAQDGEWGAPAGHG
ncbi:hypothetical protein [Streptomyces sp. S.PNR 29]|uniref:hypothetical protein n=1 Tax=Streptomyces sp. S.PNR 29 TaxID=2973805 RepID=UPI0025AF929A|nr:hypothetical protein [Streptomyces sp. S.PNR 29]MDN0198733.1 hypothetical protein [Streptomyces sp. S.PNR 29]